eukprot:6862337-Pyramimonas_sp.AAC.1
MDDQLGGALWELTVAGDKDGHDDEQPVDDDVLGAESFVNRIHERLDRNVHRDVLVLLVLRADVAAPRAIVHVLRAVEGIFARWTNQVQAARAYSHDGPIGRKQRGHILMMDQSDAGSAGIFS